MADYPIPEGSFYAIDPATGQKRLYTVPKPQGPMLPGTSYKWNPLTRKYDFISPVATSSSTRPTGATNIASTVKRPKARASMFGNTLPPAGRGNQMAYDIGRSRLQAKSGFGGMDYLTNTRNLTSGQRALNAQLAALNRFAAGSNVDLGAGAAEAGTSPSMLNLSRDILAAQEMGQRMKLAQDLADVQAGFMTSEDARRLALSQGLVDLDQQLLMAREAAALADLDKVLQGGSQGGNR